MFRFLTLLVVLIVVIVVVALFYLDMNFLVSIGLVCVTAVASQPISDNDSLRLISVVSFLVSFATFYFVFKLRNLN